MPASRRTPPKRGPRSDASPLTVPRYLFASDAESLATEAGAGLAECRQHLEAILAHGGPRAIDNLPVPYHRPLSGLPEPQGQSKSLFDGPPAAPARPLAANW